MTTTHARPLSPHATSGPWAQVAPFVALTKPRVSVMVLATAGAGVALGPAPSPTRSALGLAGTWAIVAAANALNMAIERETDARMPRTAGRPIPAGALGPGAAVAFAAVLAVAALAMLAAAAPLAAASGAAALVIYAGIYTPLKRTTRASLYVGALAGAAPPAMGYFAAGGGLDAGALWLFALQWVWQVPHALAIAVFRGEEYRAAGLALGVPRAERAAAGRALVAWSVVVVFVGLLGERAGVGSPAATVAAALSGGAWLAYVGAAPPSLRARRAFLGSMAHLLVVLLAAAVLR